MLTLTKEIPVTDDNLKEAISILCSPVFGALNMANAFAGDQTGPWLIIRNVKPIQKIFVEAKERGLDLDTLECAVEGGLVKDRPLFQRFMTQISR